MIFIVMNCGIYKIVNKKNNKVYVGSSVNLKSREYKHFWMLNKGIHDNHHLQQSYSKYGKDLFMFEVIEYCEPGELVLRENYHISHYKANLMDYGYNLATVNEFRRNTYNDVVKKNLSIYNINKNNNFKTFSLENIENKCVYIFDNLVDAANYFILNGFSKGSNRNVRQKISNALRGKKVNNGGEGSIRKTIYKHNFQIIN